MHTKISLPLILLLICSAALAAQDIRLIDSLYRVDAAINNTDNRQISTIYGSRGETVSFQVVIQTDTDLDSVDLYGTDLTLNTQTIAKENVVIFREHYMSIRTASPGAPISASRVPDALIPLRNPYTGEVNLGGTYPASGFKIFGGAHQAYWVDVIIPRDASNGTYSGEIVITNSGVEIARKIYTLVVWNSTLPLISSLKTSVGFSTRDQLETFYELTRWTEEEYETYRKFADCMLDHRLSFPYSRDMQVSSEADGKFAPITGQGKWDTRTVYKYYMVERGMTCVSLPMWDNWPVNDQLDTGRQEALRYMRTLLDFARRDRWDDRIYNYQVDEPSSQEDYDKVRAWGDLVHTADSRYKNLVTEQPQPENPNWGVLTDAVDTWVILPQLYLQSEVNKRLAAGDEVWLYTALVQDDYSPKWLMDYRPIEYRIYPWIIYALKLNGLMYWETTYWDENPDVWNDPASYIDDGRIMNGEGMLIYPGTVETVGYDGPVASMRLKWIRDGVEDFDLLTLKSKNDRSKVYNLAKQVGKDLKNWTTNTKKLMRIRKQIGEMITSGRIKRGFPYLGF
jgi:hypothetical protein